MIMFRFGKTTVAKEEFYGAKQPIKIQNVDVDNIVISKSIETKNNSKYLIEYLDEVVGPLVLVLLIMSGYDKTFKNKDMIKENLMSVCVDNDKVLEKYKTIWIQTKIEDLGNIELNIVPVYDDRYIIAKVRTYGDKVYSNFCNLNVPEDGEECESFTIISISSAADKDAFVDWLVFCQCVVRIMVSKGFWGFLESYSTQSSKVRQAFLLLFCVLQFVI